MTNKKPKISVIVTSYNLKRFLKTTIDSILGQNYNNYELIIIDGKSSDGSAQELTEFSKKYSQIRLISEKDGGYPDALWKGIKLARGKYLMQCAISDMYANPDWLAICADTLDNNPRVSLVWGFPQYISERGKVEKVSYLQFHEKPAPSGKEFFKYWLKTGFFFPEGNLCVRKKVLIKCYPSLKEMKPHILDWLEFSYRFNKQGYLSMHIPVVANYGRRHKSQMGTSIQKNGQLKRMSLYYFGEIALYRLKLLTGLVKHKFVDEYNYNIDSMTKKLHLGCGQIYLKGYINIDYPKINQNVQKVKADHYKDITKLNFSKNSIDEIRLHHVFEHFDRPTALALLCCWREWLKPNGLLHIETPDAMASYKILVSPKLNYSNKQQVIRHLHGSHEAKWAIHKDGWYKEKYLYTLKKLGYENIQFRYNKWGHLRNIEVFAYRSNKNMTFLKYQKLSKEILVDSTIRVAGGAENKLLKHWLKVWDKIISNNYA